MRKVAVVNTFSPKYFPLPINKVLEPDIRVTEGRPGYCQRVHPVFRL